MENLASTTTTTSSSSYLSSLSANAGVKSFVVILISEIGDKTFLIAAIMAMTHPRLLIFSAAIAALGVMTVLSAFLGQVVPTLISKKYTQFLAAILFVVFGIKMLWDASSMTGNEAQEEMNEVTQELLEKDHDAKKHGKMMEEGNGVKGSSSPKRGSSSPKKSKSSSPSRSKSKQGGDSKSSNTTLNNNNNNSSGGGGGIGSMLESLKGGCINLANLFFSPVFIQTFIMTFLAEWGDRSQITSMCEGEALASSNTLNPPTLLPTFFIAIALAGAEDFWFVSIGGLLGHSICTAVAVIGGKMVR